VVKKKIDEKPRQNWNIREIVAEKTEGGWSLFAK